MGRLADREGLAVERLHFPRLKVRGDHGARLHDRFDDPLAIRPADQAQVWADIGAAAIDAMATRTVGEFRVLEDAPARLEIELAFK